MGWHDCCLLRDASAENLCKRRGSTADTAPLTSRVPKRVYIVRVTHSSLRPFPPQHAVLRRARHNIYRLQKQHKNAVLKISTGIISGGSCNATLSDDALAMMKKNGDGMRHSSTMLNAWEKTRKAGLTAQMRNVPPAPPTAVFVLVRRSSRHI